MSLSKNIYRILKGLVAVAAIHVLITSFELNHCCKQNHFLVFRFEIYFINPSILNWFVWRICSWRDLWLHIFFKFELLNWTLRFLSAISFDAFHFQGEASVLKPSKHIRSTKCDCVKDDHLEIFFQHQKMIASKANACWQTLGQTKSKPRTNVREIFDLGIFSSLSRKIVMTLQDLPGT